MIENLWGDPAIKHNKANALGRQKAPLVPRSATFGSRLREALGTGTLYVEALDEGILSHWHQAKTLPNDISVWMLIRNAIQEEAGGFRDNLSRSGSNGV